MKVRFDALLVALGCPGVSTADALHPCPKCHHKPCSMRISYSSRSTYFTCPQCGLSADALELAALCLGISDDAAAALFATGGALNHTLVPGNAESTLTDYTKDDNSQVIMNELHATSRARIDRSSNYVARSDLEKRGIRGLPLLDTGSLSGLSLQRLEKSRLVTRTGRGGTLRARSEYVVHFTRYAGRLSGFTAREAGTDDAAIRFIVTNGPETDSGGVYAANYKRCPGAETLYVMATPEDVCRLMTRRSIYTDSAADAVAITGFPLPPDYTRVRDIVFVTDGSEVFEKFIAASADLDLLACSGAKPALHVFDCRGEYEARDAARMLREALPVATWLANHLARSFRRGGEDAVAAVVASAPGIRRLSTDIQTCLPGGPDLAPLREILLGEVLSDSDFIDVPGAGRTYRTADSMLSLPTGNDEGPGLVANFRAEVLKRVTRTDKHGAVLPYLYQLRLAFRSGSRYNLYVPDAALSTGARLVAYITARVSTTDRPVLYTGRKAYNPAAVITAFDTGVSPVEVPTAAGLRGDWLELPRIRINVTDGTVDSQVDSAPVAKLPCLNGLSYARYRESLVSVRRVWAGESAVEKSLALCLSHAVFCAVQDVVFDRARAFHAPARLTVVNDNAALCREIVHAFCHIVNGSPSAYVTSSAKSLAANYRSLPVLVSVPNGRAYDYVPEDAPPAIVVANPASATQASVLDRPVYLVPSEANGAVAPIRNSTLEHLQASFPYFVNCAVNTLSGMSHRLLDAQRLPALYMHRLLARTFNMKTAGSVDALVSDKYESPGCGPVDLFFSAMQQLCYAAGGVSIGNPGSAVAVDKSSVFINKSLYGRIAAYGRKRFNYAPSLAVLTAALETSQYYYACDDVPTWCWSLSREAWDSRIACIRPERGETGTPALRIA